MIKVFKLSRLLIDINKQPTFQGRLKTYLFQLFNRLSSPIFKVYNYMKLGVQKNQNFVQKSLKVSGIENAMSGWSKLLFQVQSTIILSYSTYINP